MPRTLLVCELATAHGGDVDLAADMIRAAADAGADLCKLQSYSKASINPEDPQAAWLLQAHLDEAAHERLITVGQDAGIEVFSTPFCVDSLAMLRRLGLARFKIASSESGNTWWTPQDHEQWFVSWPWGRVALRGGRAKQQVDLTAIPLYPTPLEAVGRAAIRAGWSDHTIGLDACLMSLAHGSAVIEAHLTIPGARCKPWDKTPAQFRQLRDFAEACETMRSGVGQVFRERWQHA